MCNQKPSRHPNVAIHRTSRLNKRLPSRCSSRTALEAHHATISLPRQEKLPPATDWRTTDTHEVLKRRLCAREDKARVENLDPAHPVFSNFSVRSPSGLVYRVEIRDLTERQFACSCTDFRINGLGTCKHIEAVLLHLNRRPLKETLRVARSTGSRRVDIVPDPLRVGRNAHRLPPRLRALFSSDLPDEAHEPLQTAALAHAQATAIRARAEAPERLRIILTE